MALRQIKRNMINCYNLDNIGDHNIIDWTNNRSTGEVIDVMAYPTILLVYKHFNDTISGADLCF